MTLNLKKYGLERKFPKLMQLQKELVGLQQHRTRAERQLTVWEQHLQQAENKDAAIAAEAIRAGKEMPEPENERKAQLELDSARRTLAATTRAVQAVEAEISQFVSENREELLSSVRSAVHDMASELAEHARKAASLYSVIDSAKYDLKALAPPPQAVENSEPARSTVSMIGIRLQPHSNDPQSGHVLEHLEFLASLEQRFEEPEPREPASESGAA